MLCHCACINLNRQELEAKPQFANSVLQDAFKDIDVDDVEECLTNAGNAIALGVDIEETEKKRKSKAVC